MKSKNKISPIMIVAACLVVVFVILLLVIFNTVGKTKTVSNDMTSLEYYFRRGNYDEIHTIIRRNDGRNVKKNSEYMKYEAVSDYFDNAFRYRVHKEMNDGQEAPYYEAMQDAKSHMGDFDFAADDIDRIVNQ